MIFLYFIPNVLDVLVYAGIRSLFNLSHLRIIFPEHMTTKIANIIFYFLTLLCSVVQICVSLYVFFLLIARRLIIREQRLDYLLYANTYLAMFFVAIVLIDMCVYSIYEQIYMEISFNGWWCKSKAYFLYISGSTFFYTFALQAFYRFCRILYRTRVRLYSFRLYIILAIGLWILSFFSLLPSFLIGDIEYIPNDYHCQVAPTSIRGSLTVFAVGFVFPFSETVGFYVWAMCNIRKQTAALIMINQQANIHRDIIVLKRLVLLLSIITFVAAPHAYLPIIYAITRYLPLWIVSLEWMLTSLALSVVSILLLFISPHLKKLRTRLHAVHPVQNMTITAGQRQ